MLLVSPITWDHYLLVLLLPVAVYWYYAATSLPRQIGLAALLVVPVYVPGVWLWRAFSPAGIPVMQRVASPLQALTILGLSTSMLVLLAVLLATSRPPAEESAEP